MKVKMLVAIAASSLFAASLAYAAPASQLVDDYNSVASMDSSAGQSSVSGMPSDSSMPGTTSGSAANPMNPGQSDTTGTGSSSDDMSADTATGDDDY